LSQILTLGAKRLVTKEVYSNYCDTIFLITLSLKERFEVNNLRSMYQDELSLSASGFRGIYMGIYAVRSLTMYASIMKSLHRNRKNKMYVCRPTSSNLYQTKFVKLYVRLGLCATHPQNEESDAFGEILATFATSRPSGNPLDSCGQFKREMIP
jgi:hypothetical protein